MTTSHPADHPMVTYEAILALVEQDQEAHRQHALRHLETLHGTTIDIDGTPMEVHYNPAFDPGHVYLLNRDFLDQIHGGAGWEWSTMVTEWDDNKLSVTMTGALKPRNPYLGIATTA